MSEIMRDWIIPIFMLIAMLAATGAAITLCVETWMNIRKQQQNDRDTREISKLNDLWKR